MCEPRLLVRLESGLFNRKHVASGRKPEQMVVAMVVRRNREVSAGAKFFPGHYCFLDSSAGWIEYRAEHLRLSRLPEARQRKG